MLHKANDTIDLFQRCSGGGNNNWFISTQEVELCTIEEFLWVKVLPLIDYVPPADPFGN
jgi:hypothetical protein